LLQSCWQKQVFGAALPASTVVHLEESPSRTVSHEMVAEEFGIIELLSSRENPTECADSIIGLTIIAYQPVILLQLCLSL
jgi:hypothetical protein